MGHHHNYFTTIPPNNYTHNNSKKNTNSVYIIIFFIFGIIFIWNYIKYLQDKYRPRQNIIYQNDNEEEEDFPDINNFFPNFLDRRVPQAPPLPPPPAYETEESRNLQEIEPPSYDSIVNRIEPNPNLDQTENTENNQSLSV